MVVTYLFMCFLIIIIIPKTFGKIVEVQCPDYCKCDNVAKFRRATCTHHNLVVLGTNFPKQTQLLDVSYNQISHLEENAFFNQELTSLKLLNISNNRLSQIHINAFRGLKRLKTMDLSYNSIQYILTNWFWELESIEELYLRGNSFGRFNSGPLFTSKTLKRLDLSLSKIVYLDKESFINIPNLEMIDVSENYLQTLSSSIIKPLINLHILKADNNKLSCNQDLKNLLTYTKTKGIRFVDPCTKNLTINMDNKFEKMIIAPTLEEEKNSWFFDEEEEGTPTITNITDCINPITTPKPSLLVQIVNLSPFLTIFFPLVFGIAIGMLLAYTTQFYRIEAKAQTKRNSFRPRTYSNLSRKREPQIDCESLVMNETITWESTPLATRKG